MSAFVPGRKKPGRKPMPYEIDLVQVEVDAGVAFARIDAPRIIHVKQGERLLHL